MLGGSGARFDGDTFGDVYIDDLILLVLSPHLESPLELTCRLAAADEIYRELGLPTKVEKGDEGCTKATFWGGELCGETGILGAPISKRADIMGLTMWALTQRLSKAELQRLLGSWVYIVGFRKEALSVLEFSYTYVYQMQEHDGHEQYSHFL